MRTMSFGPEALTTLIAALRGDAGPWAAPMAVHIVGLTGTEGTALAELLCARLAGRVRVTGHDFSSELQESFEKAHVALEKAEKAERFAALMALPGLQVQTGSDYLKGIDGADLIFVGQNWRAYQPNYPSLFTLQGKIPFAQMTDLYLQLTPCALIGVTGTNGKTTTCNWIKAMAEGERDARVSGNDLLSTQSLTSVLEMSPEGLLVLETSNRQARDMHSGPPIAAVTSLAPDHLAEHGGWQGYVQAKRRLIETQKAGDAAVLNYDCPHVSSYAEYAPGRVYWASAAPLPDGKLGAFRAETGELVLRLENEQVRLCHERDLKVPGKHNLLNGLISAVAARLAGVSISGIQRGLAQFEGVKNRIQLAAEVDGVRYINDLASTTPWATIAALEAFETPSHLIVGGSVKAEEGFDALAAVALKRAASIVALPGRASELLLGELKGALPVAEVEDIDAAIEAAAARAEAGEQVLMSPAGAGFYTSFLGKNGSFVKSVRRLGRKRVRA